MTTALDALKQYFGYDSFRPGQEELIVDILARRDVLGVMPTGAGKSICFQVPALILEGVTIVVSPLISLMKDQVNALNQAGVPAAFINSSLNDRQISKALRNAENGAYRLIYVAPERLMGFDFLSFAVYANIAMVVVDEAHCVSQWGQDFRPSYTQIPQFLARLATRPVLAAFTATATPRVRDDIVSSLALREPAVLVTGFDRPNLHFDVLKPLRKMDVLVNFLSENESASSSGIIYCSTRNAVDDVCFNLRQAGYSAARYHAGLEDEERQKAQEDFLFDRVKIMVATNAFGMGIDKSNVSFVVHYNMPSDIEAYYQEAGRAGRDGAAARCLLLHGGRDFSTNMWLIENGENRAVLSHEDELALKKLKIKRLNEMDAYCKTTSCLRSYILKYFGEQQEGTRCGNCGNCGADFVETDITIDAQKIISCVVRMREKFGVKMVIDVLRGSRTSRVVSFRLDQLKTFGTSEKSQEKLTSIVNHLILEGYLHKTSEQYPLLKLGKRAQEALEKDASIYMLMPTGKHKAEVARQLEKPLYAVNSALLDALKTLRADIARQRKLPAFVIFHDTTLIDMCAKMPANMAELLRVSGVGEVKATRYGQAFLDVIAEFSQDSPAPFTQIPFDPNEVEIEEENIPLGQVIDNINALLIQCGLGKLTAARVNNWLISQGLLEGEDKSKTATPQGTLAGIITENRMSLSNNPYTVNVFTPQAQGLIAQNALKI